MGCCRNWIIIGVGKKMISFKDVYLYLKDDNSVSSSSGVVQSGNFNGD